MLTKRKNIRKKSPNVFFFFFQKFRKSPSVWPRESNNQNLKEILRALGSEIIASHGRTDHRRRTDGLAKFRFHEVWWHSQAELKLPISQKLLIAERNRVKFELGYSCKMYMRTFDILVFNVILGSFGALISKMACNSNTGFCRAKRGEI